MHIIYTMEYYSAIKNNEVLPFAGAAVKRYPALILIGPFVSTLNLLSYVSNGLRKPEYVNSLWDQYTNYFSLRYS